MFIELKEEEVEKYIDYLYEISLDQTKCCYPIYSDGIKTKEDFVRAVKDSFSDESETAMLFEVDEKVEGLVQFYWIQEDKYITPYIFSINRGMKQALEEFIEYISEEFKDYELYMGFPKQNRDAAEFLEANGFELIEASYDDNISLAEYSARPEKENVTAIDSENYDLFRRLHTNDTEEMYWTADRIFDDLGNWTIFVYMKNGQAEAAIYYLNEGILTEIFGVDYREVSFDKDAFSALLDAALGECSRRGVRNVVFFGDKENQETTLGCGFRCVGEYVCYKKIV